MENLHGQLVEHIDDDGVSLIPVGVDPTPVPSGSYFPVIRDHTIAQTVQVELGFAGVVILVRMNG